jgi:hypothetical protein
MLPPLERPATGEVLDDAGLVGDHIVRQPAISRIAT